MNNINLEIKDIDIEDDDINEVNVSNNLQPSGADAAVEEDAVEDAVVEEDAAVEDAAVQDDAVQDDAVQDDAVEEDAVEYAVEEDAAVEDAVDEEDVELTEAQKRKLAGWLNNETMNEHELRMLTTQHDLLYDNVKKLQKIAERNIKNMQFKNMIFNVRKISDAKNKERNKLYVKNAPIRKQLIKAPFKMKLF